MKLATAVAVAFCLGATSPSMAADETAPAAAPQGNAVPDGQLAGGVSVPKRDLNKEFEDLTPSERIGIRAAAKTDYEQKKLDRLVVCADPGNMPFSDEKLEGFENKIAEVLGKATGAQVSLYWRPSYERGMTRQTFDTGMCDAMIDIPTGYSSLLTTDPIYRTTYVLAYRNDKGINIKNFDDPALKKLKIGVYETSGVRDVLLKHGLFDNVSIQTVTHDADINVKDQPWYQVQQAVDGKLDIAAVWGPFAGWVKSKGEPITIQPVNLWEDTEPLEFDLAIGVRKTDVLLKYILDFALEDHKVEIGKILKDYGVPLVQCSRCVVEGDLPSHGSYTKVAQTQSEAAPSSNESAKLQDLKKRLASGADPNQELGAAIIANDADRVKVLVGNGADISKRDDQGYTPLTSAAFHDYTDLMKLLIGAGANVNAVDGNGMTPLEETIMRDDVPALKLLIDSDADTNKADPQGLPPLALAIEEQKYETAKALIEAGANVNSVASKDQLTPLMIAAAESQPAEGSMFLPTSTRPIDIAKALIKRGADVNAKDKDGMTALMVATSHDNAPTIGLLLQSGANAEAKNNRGEQALDIAKLNGNQEAAQAISVLGKALSATGAPPAGQARGDKS